MFMALKYLKSILKSQISLKIHREDILQTFQIKISIYSCNLVDVDHPSRNFTTRKYTSEINGITLYNDDDLRVITICKKVYSIKENCLKAG